ncbi:S-layer homology domain-containing protein [Agathobaculum sp.]|uniref:S-layer homology domain-containing protein n=1 Tax=Agathobaculum sp. TaxID=2048138 RepID=UPI002A7F901E|nr:S-layer homology domain-containing protein [Agathobaculum sp.]MDY3618189.1 S-layer homology domain-containing protein [Agathobaculum sp.]
MKMAKPAVVLGVLTLLWGIPIAGAADWDIASGPLVIDAPGTYHITQSAERTDNAISITTTEDVTLVLQGVHMETSGSVPISAAGGGLTIELIGENKIAAASADDGVISGIQNPAGRLAMKPSGDGGSLTVAVDANCFPTTAGTCSGIVCGSFVNDADLQISVAGSDNSNCPLAAIYCNDKSDAAVFQNNAVLNLRVRTDSVQSGAFPYAAGVMGYLKDFTNTGSIRVDVRNTNKDAYGISYYMRDGGALSNIGEIELGVAALGGTGEGFTGSGGFSNNATGIDLRCGGAAAFENDGNIAISAVNYGNSVNNAFEYADAVSIMGGGEPAYLTNRGSMVLKAACGYSYGIYAENWGSFVTIRNYGEMDIYATTRGQETGDIDHVDNWDLARGIYVAQVCENRENPILVLEDGSETKIVTDAEAGYSVSEDQLQAAVVDQYYEEGPRLESAPPQIELKDGLAVEQGGGVIQRFPQEQDEGMYYYTTAFGPDADHYAKSLYVVSPRISIALTLDGQPYRGQQVALDAASTADFPSIAAAEKNGVYTATAVSGAYYIYVNGVCVNPGEPLLVGQVGAQTSVAYYTLSFDLNGAGGAEPSGQIVLSGQKPSEPAAPSRSGYRFLGWRTKAAGGEPFSFEQAVTAVTRVYAAWEKTGSSGSGGVSSSTTSTTTNPDGSKTTTVTDQRTGTVTETTIKADGGSVKVETAKDGTVTTTEKQKDGTQVKTVSTHEHTTAEVEIPNSGAETEVTIPVPDVGPGTVAVIVREDGTREIVKTSLPTGEGIAVTLSENATLEIIDNSKVFDDVTEDTWYASAVEFATARELLQGTGGQAFSPAESTTRAMVVTMLYRLENEPDAAAGDFTDIPQGKWYSDAIAWAAVNKVVEGVGAGQFAPERSISRQELAVILYRYAGSPAPPNLALTFADAEQVSGYAENALRWAVAEGIVAGKPGNLLDPEGSATRAEATVMLQRYLMTEWG